MKMGCVRTSFIFAALWILNKTGADTTNLTSEEDEVGQVLPYWEPKPIPNARRTVENENFLIKPINKVPSYRRGKPLEPIASWSSHEESDKNTTRRKGVKVSKKYNYNNNSKGRPLSYNREIKLRHNRASQDKEEARSTRIAPLHLMQQQEVQKPKLDSGDEKEKLKVPEDNFSNDNFILNVYSIEKQFTSILSEFNEAEFSTEILGRTASYIDIVLFKISQKGSQYFRAHETKYVENETKDKKILFIVHALSPMGVPDLYSLTLHSHLRMLLSYYLAHLDKFDIYLIPMANPDGYLKTKSVSFWNKNMAPSSGCAGVDVDRNFDVAWNNTQDQLNSCSQHYPGVAPFSEPESRAVRNIFHRMSHKIVAYFHVHAGTYKMTTFKGDAVLYPKGYTDLQSDDDRYIDLKGEIDEAIKNANFKVLSVTMDTLYNWYGKVSGTSVDYAASVYGIPYAMELVLQLYQDAFYTQFKKMTKLGPDFTSMEFHSLSEIWKRVIDVIFTNIYKKLEASEAARIR